MKRLIAAVLTATTMTLAACTATAGSDPTTAPGKSTGTSPAASAAPTTTGPTTTDRIESWLSDTTSTSAPPTVDATTSDPATGASDTTTVTSTAATGDTYDTIPVTIPAAITGAGLKAANAAIPVWRNAMRLYDQSMQDPSADWTAKLRKYVVDPAAIAQLSLVAAFAKDGMHQIGETGYTAEVIAAKEHNVQIRACVDATRVDVVDGDGTSITSGSPRRFLWEFNIDFYPNEVSHWLLNLVTKPNPTKPC